MLGFENLVYSVFEFVSVLIDTSKFRAMVKTSINDILYYVILYMQMTDDQVIMLNQIIMSPTQGRATYVDHFNLPIGLDNLWI